MTDFSPEVCDAICEDIADGVSLREACRKEGRPSKTSFLRWLGDPERGALRDQYARAREAQADHYADAIIDIVDNDPDPTRARVRMDGRKWVASKLLPKKYGDKQETTLQGPGGSALSIAVSFE